LKDQFRGNRQLMRAMNTKLVLDRLRGANTLSQADLVQQTQLSVGTIVRIVADLKQRSLIEEVGPGQASGAGRKPLQLRFCRDNRFVVGAELAPDEMTIALFDLGGTILNEMRYDLPPQAQPETIVTDFRTQLWQLLRSHRIARSKVAGLGMSTPGGADHETGHIMYSKHLEWHDVPLRDMLQEALKMPIFIDSHARTMTLAEHRWGAGKSATDMILVEIDVGIGIVAITRGQISRGRHSMAGELGQNIVTWDGHSSQTPLCLEDLASGKAMIQLADKRAEQKPKSPLHKLMDVPSLRRALRMLFDADADGDAIARQTIQSAARHLGIAIAQVINVHDPSHVILAGSVVSESRGVFSAHVRDAAMKHVFAADLRELTIEPAALDDRATLIGAATLVYDDLFAVDGAIVTNKG
jgi:N-acetylglucosamine repressor